MQFCGVSKQLLQAEAGAVAKILKVPRNAVPAGAKEFLDVLGVPSAPSLCAGGQASMIRAWMKSPVADQAATEVE